MTAAALAPAETISAAVAELYDRLKEIVDRGPTDDPGLLDELGKLTGKIRRRITTARKRAAATLRPEGGKSADAETSVAQKATQVLAPTSMVENTTRPTAGQPPAKQDEPAGQHAGQPVPLTGTRAVPATTRETRPVPPHAPRVTVPIAPTTSVPRSSTPVSGNEEQPVRASRWTLLLVFVLAVVAGALVSATDVSPWWLSIMPVGAVLTGAAGRWRTRRSGPKGGAR